MSNLDVVVQVIALGTKVLSSRAAVFLGILAAVGLFIAALCVQTWMALCVAGGFAVVVLWPLLLSEGKRNE